MKTNTNVTLNYREYGEITIPKGTAVTHNTACGVDKNYHFVNEFSWIDTDYPNIASILKMDAKFYGINIPKEFIEY